MDYETSAAKENPCLAEFISDEVVLRGRKNMQILKLRSALKSLQEIEFI